MFGVIIVLQLEMALSMNESSSYLKICMRVTGLA